MPPEERLPPFLTDQLTQAVVHAPHRTVKQLGQLTLAELRVLLGELPDPETGIVHCCMDFGAEHSYRKAETLISRTGTSRDKPTRDLFIHDANDIKALRNQGKNLDHGTAYGLF